MVEELYVMMAAGDDHRSISNVREHVYLRGLGTTRENQLNLTCKIGFVWNKGFYLNDRFVPLHKIRFVSNRRNQNQFETADCDTVILLCHICPDTDSAEIVHLVLEMGTVYETKKLFLDFQNLMKAKFRGREALNEMVYELVNKQPLYYKKEQVVVKEKMTNISTVYICEVVIDLECVALYPVTESGDKDPYMLTFSMEIGGTHINLWEHLDDSEYVEIQTEKYTFKMAANAGLVSSLRECRPVCLADVDHLRQYVSSEEYSGEQPSLVRQEAEAQQNIYPLSRFIVAIGDAVFVCNSVDKALEQRWLAAEVALKDAEAKGDIPVTYPAALRGKSDETNPEHFRQALMDVVHQLTQYRYKDALSLLRAVREVFENSTLPEIRELFNATDMGILQKLFSWNLVFGRAGSGASSCRTDPGWGEGEPARLSVIPPYASSLSNNAEENKRREMKFLIAELEDATNQAEQDETMQMFWICLEADLSAILQSGLVPETEPESGGLDPDNPEHLKRALNDISDHLKKERLSLALSRLTATKKIFMESQSEHIQQLFSMDDLIILKKLYFRSLME